MSEQRHGLGHAYVLAVPAEYAGAGSGAGSGWSPLPVVTTHNSIIPTVHS